jgi:hypothetical protein
LKFWIVGLDCTILFTTIWDVNEICALYYPESFVEQKKSFLCFTKKIHQLLFRSLPFSIALFLSDDMKNYRFPSVDFDLNPISSLLMSRIKSFFLQANPKHTKR